VATATETRPPAQGLRAIDPAPFRLRPDGFDEAPAAEGLGAVLADLDRHLRPFGPGLGAPWAARRAVGLTGGFRWDPDDSRTGAWYPQGIAASADGTVLLVSWYRKGTNVARLTCVGLETGRYRHLRLMTATGEPVLSHAGGLAWREDLLYVADTKAGLRVFDLARVRRTQAAGDDRYALPQAGRYRSAGGGLRFSFASVDEGADGLLVGEYTDKVPGARMVRWPFGPGGLLAQEAASHAWVTAHSNLQGALALPDRMLMAESRGPVRSGTLHASPYAERAERRRWAVGGEDLALAGGEVVSLTEHPDLPRPLPMRRTVFRARLG
jgi:hypothetical protein